MTADGLRALAGRCEALAASLASTVPTTTGASEQASMAAVGACDGRIGAAGEELAAWATATAGTLTTAAGAYERTDTDSGGKLDTVVI